MIAATLRANGATGGRTDKQPMVAAPLTRGSATGQGVNQPWRRQEDDVNLVGYALNAKAGYHDGDADTTYVPNGASVRRLTPTECERLQGFPDGWTQLGDTPDSRRYAALGDAVTVTVAEWIGRRIVAHATDAHPTDTASRPAPTYVASVVGTAGGRGPRGG